MKVAICSTGNTMDSRVDLRFGRCGYFLVVDNESGESEFIANSGNAAGGAGIKAAQILVGKGVKAIVAGRVGPNAMEVLKAAGIEVYSTGEGTVRSVYEQFRRNKLTLLGKANAPKHNGLKR